jgi:hypothetical protein
LKLNLGCGQNKIPGFVNVDEHGDPDVRHDLEAFPWPWADDTFEEVRANHVLEHLGQDPDIFIGVMKEIYRVARPGAQVLVAVPHPRHDDFLSDPTHVRPVTPLLMALFCRRLNLEWQAMGAANSPLALFHRVDFELQEVQLTLDEPYLSEYQAGRLSEQEVDRLARERNNVVKEIRMRLQAVKPFGGQDAGAHPPSKV